LFNPTRLSGICGRLKCCLRYELETYKEFLDNCPAVEQKISDPKKGEGIIEKLDMVLEQISIRYDNGETEKFSLEQFRTSTDWKRGMPKEQRITICSRPEPVVEREAPPPEAPSKESLASLVGAVETKLKKEPQDKKTARPPQPKPQSRPPSTPAAAKAKPEQQQPSADKKSRHRRHRKKKKPPKSPTPS
jgi:hypothetical protein